MLEQIRQMAYESDKTTILALRIEMRILALLFGIWTSLMVHAGWAQSVDSLQMLYKQGVQAYQQSAYQQAAFELQPVFDRAPEYYGAQGSVAYYLGESLWKLGQEEEALRVLLKGLSAMHKSGRVDPRAADAFIHYVFSDRLISRYRQATWAYLELLRTLDRKLSQEEEKIVTRHVAQMVFLLPEEMKHALFAFKKGKIKTIRPGAGEHLVYWWKAQDPLPATPQNERLQEHLERVVYAENNYAHPGAQAGFDDRGMIYVRLGAPKFTQEVRMLDKGIYKNTMSPFRSALDLNRNEFWSYRHISPTLYYLFVERDGGYRISLPEELIPASMRHASTVQNRWRALLEVWQVIYGQLALMHPDFVEQSIEVDNMMGGAQGQDPSAFVLMNRMRYRRQDKISAQRRDKVAPRVYSESMYVAEHLPVEVRFARFLDERGNTRVHVYWGHNPVTFTPGKSTVDEIEEKGYTDKGRYMVALTALSKRPDYELVDQRRQQYLVSSQEPNLVIRKVGLQGVAPYFHVALQWDVYIAEITEAQKVRVGPRIKVGTFAEDTLQVLQSDPEVLEMSDLVPWLVGAVPENPDSLVWYPFQAISPETRLGLYFEVYHLAFGEDDRTHYRVEYEIIHLEDQKRIAHIAAHTPYEGTSRKSKEYMELDLSHIQQRGPVRIRVTVTDEVTGQQVSRSIDFNLLGSN